MMKQFFQLESIATTFSRTNGTVPSETRGPLIPAQDSTLQPGGKGTSGNSEMEVTETAGHTMSIASYVNISILSQLKTMAECAPYPWMFSPLVARDTFAVRIMSQILPVNKRAVLQKFPRKTSLHVHASGKRIVKFNIPLPRVTIAVILINQRAASSRRL